MKWKSRLAARWVEEVEARGEGANTKVHKEEANMKQKLENEEKRRRMLLALQPSQLKKIVHHLSRHDIVLSYICCFIILRQCESFIFITATAVVLKQKFVNTKNTSPNELYGSCCRSDIDFIIRAYKNKKGFEKLYKENVVRRDLMKSF